MYFIFFFSLISDAAIIGATVAPISPIAFILAPYPAISLPYVLVSNAPCCCAAAKIGGGAILLAGTSRPVVATCPPLVVGEGNPVNVAISDKGTSLCNNKSDNCLSLILSCSATRLAASLAWKLLKLVALANCASANAWPSLIASVATPCKVSFCAPLSSANALLNAVDPSGIPAFINLVLRSIFCCSNCGCNLLTALL